MPLQDDLDRAMTELDEKSPETLAIYAYACFRLLSKKRPNAVNDGSFGLYIQDSPVYVTEFEHEMPMVLDVEFSVKEHIDGDGF